MNIKNKFSIILITLIFSCFFSYTFASNNIIDTKANMEKYWDLALFYYDFGINTDFLWEWEIQNVESSKLIYTGSNQSNSVKLPRLSWEVKIISEKLWKDNFIKLTKAWIISIEWSTNKFSTYESYTAPFWVAEKYFDSDENDLVETKWYIANISKYMNLSSESNQTNKIIVRPFDNDELWTRFTSWLEWPTPKLVIYDDIYLPINMNLDISNDDFSKQNLKPEVKYDFQKYLITNDDWTESYSYIMIPYYVFDVDVKKWKNKIKIYYNEYIWTSSTISIYEYDWEK